MLSFALGKHRTYLYSWALKYPAEPRVTKQCLVYGGGGGGRLDKMKGVREYILFRNPITFHIHSLFKAAEV